MFGDLIQGAIALYQPITMGLFFIGVVVGIILGIIPGITGMIGIMLLLPFIYGASPTVALPVMLAILGSSSTGGVITTILLNVPGDEVNVAALLDGFPMTKRGEGGRALGAAIFSSLSGGVVSVILALIAMPAVIWMVKVMGTPEQTVLVLVGLAFVGILGGKSILKGALAGLLGLLISFIGYQANTGEARFIFHQGFLYDGLQLVPIVLGLFALPQMFVLAEEGVITDEVMAAAKTVHGIFQGMKDVFRCWWLFLRSTVIGWIVGVTPGLGASSAIFVAYGQAMKTSKHPERYGTGIVEGVIAPSSACCAVQAGALLPTLGFAVPGSASMVVILGGMVAVGLVPGPGIITDQLPLCFTLLLATLTAHILAGVLCLLSLRWAIKVANIRQEYLVPVTIAFIFVAAFVTRTEMWNIIVLLVFTLIGYCMMKFDYSRPALLLGYILGAMFERSLYISIDLYGAVWLTRPIVMLLLAIVVLVAFYSPLKFGIVKLVKLGKMRRQYER